MGTTRLNQCLSAHPVMLNTITLAAVQPVPPATTRRDSKCAASGSWFVVQVDRNRWIGHRTSVVHLDSRIVQCRMPRKQLRVVYGTDDRRVASQIGPDAVDSKHRPRLLSRSITTPVRV